MQPGGGRGGEDGCKDQGHPPATGHRAIDREAASPSPPLFPSPERSSEKNLEDEQQQEEEEEPKLEDEQKNQQEEEQPMVSLPEDALIEILSRVPYRSLCRFKCVSKPWLALCSAPDIRKRCPQTLTGFFHFDNGLKFRNLSGRGPPMVDPSLPYLRERYKYTEIEQCCSSFLLCKCYRSLSEGQDYDFVVCNPATGWMFVLPPIAVPGGHFLNLDPCNFFLGLNTAAAPSRFVVFVPLSDRYEEVGVVAIYSSETGRWTFVQSQWGSETALVGNPECVFLHGIMHLATFCSSLVTVDAAGKVWRKIKMPDSASSSCDDTIVSIGQSQGRLYAWQIDNHADCQLYVWVLEDYDSGKWTLKHTANVLELFGRHRRKGTESYKMFAIHPDCNMFFITDREEMTVSYDMDNQKVKVISTSKEFWEGLPYTPCFAE